MEFAPSRRKNAPSVIIISLIDVLIVVLIFLIVTTTVRQQPAVKLVLPESKQSKPGSTDQTLIIDISKEGVVYVGPNNPVTIDQLQKVLTEKVKAKPDTAVGLRAHTDAPFGQIIKVMDAAKAANIRNMSAFTKGAETK